MAVSKPFQAPYGANTYLLANQLMQMAQIPYESPQNALAPWSSNFDDDAAKEPAPADYFAPMADVPSNTARVPPDTMSDVNPFASHAPVDVGEEGTSPIYPSNPTQLVDRLINYDTHGQSFDYTEAIRRAMENRRRLGRGQ